MRVVLVNPPHTAYDRSEIAPPLGLLRLAGVAGRLGCDASIADFNLRWHFDEQLRGDFYEHAATALLEADADVYGFTSMCVDSHVALELSRRVKIAKPEAIVVVGGTHFSALGEIVTSRLRWIDAVVQGEGERGFAELLSGQSSDVASSWSAPKPTDYSYIELAPYLSINSRRIADVESSRGCRFKCQFCYSPAHYQTRRTFDADVLIGELSYLKKRGIRHLFFVDDNFLNDEERAVSLCSALQEAKLGLTWHCYATAPQITPRAIKAMSRAGCTALFTGIDAIGTTSERRYGKRFSSGTEDKIRLCMDHGITPTCAFLVAPPSHGCGADTDITVRAALSARALGAHIRLNVLTYYSETKLTVSDAPHHESDVGRITLELDVPDVVIQNPYSAQWPEMFPFHARYVPASEWSRFIQQVHVLFTLLHARCDELMELVNTRQASLFDLADRVLERTGPLLLIAKPNRRRGEVDAFDALMESSSLAELAS